MIENYANLFVASFFAKTHLNALPLLKHQLRPIDVSKLYSAKFTFTFFPNIFKQFSHSRSAKGYFTNTLMASLFIDPRITMYKVVNPL